MSKYIEDSEKAKGVRLIFTKEDIFDYMQCPRKFYLKRQRRKNLVKEAKTCQNTLKHQKSVK